MVNVKLRPMDDNERKWLHNFGVQNSAIVGLVCFFYGLRLFAMEQTARELGQDLLLSARYGWAPVNRF